MLSAAVAGGILFCVVHLPRLVFVGPVLCVRTGHFGCVHTVHLLTHPPLFTKLRTHQWIGVDSCHFGHYLNADVLNHYAPYIYSYVKHIQTLGEEVDLKSQEMDGNEHT